MSELSYNLQIARGDYQTQFKAEPSEWACHIGCEIRHADAPLSVDGKVRYEIHWSCGSRKWTVTDARKFFEAGLELCAAVEKELEHLPAKRYETA